MNVGPGGNLERALAYGNHSRARKHVADVSENAVRHVKKGRSAAASAAEQAASEWAGEKGGREGLGKGQEKGRGREGVISDGRVHGGREVVEMVHDAGLSRARGVVGGTVLPVRETAAWKDLVFRASFEAVGWLCLETGAYWRHNLTEEERARTVRRRRGEHVNRLSVNVLELLGWS